MPPATMYTLKCEHHPELNYAEWCKKFYGENKAIVSPVELGKRKVAHVHFIGYSDLSKKSFEAVKVQLAEQHPKKLEKVTTLEGVEEPRFPKCKPVRQGGKQVDELGFQYVMKTSARPEYSQGFTAASESRIRVGRSRPSALAPPAVRAAPPRRTRPAGPRGSTSRIRI